MLTVVGWPRSGTHWLKAILESLSGEEVGHSHALPNQQGEYIFIIRDPRDTFFSHWKLYQYGTPDPQVTELGFVDLLMKGQMESHQGWNIGWVPYIEELLEWRAVYGYPMVRYEDLRAAPFPELSWIAFQLKLNVTENNIRTAIRDTRDTRWDPSSLPIDREMGKSEKWRGQLKTETLIALLNYCGYLMVELGYQEA